MKKGLSTAFLPQISPFRLASGCVQGAAHLRGRNISRKHFQKAGRHGHQMPGKLFSVCEQPCPNNPVASYSTFLQRPQNHSFVACCCSLRAFHRKYMETFPLFTSQDLDSYTKDLPASLGSQFGLTRPKSFSRDAEDREKFLNLFKV